MTYLCLKKQTFKKKSYELVPIRKEDMELIRQWRNDQIAILRQERPLSNADQERYWDRVLKPGFSNEKPDQILFTLLKDGAAIGYGGLTHIDWTARKGEVSFLLEPSRTADKKSYQEEFKMFLSLLKEAAFEDLKFHRIYTETFNIRPEHIAILEQSGFILEGTLKDHVKIDNKYYDSLIHGLLSNE